MKDKFIFQQNLACLEFFIYMETRANFFLQKSNEAVELGFYEVPMNFLERNYFGSLKQEEDSFLFFKKDGEDHFRWIIHPDDRKYHLDMARFLRYKELDSKIQKGKYLGYRTSSRRLVLKDPKQEKVFILKGSLGSAAGLDDDRLMSRKEVEWIQAISEYLKRREKIYSFENFRIVHYNMSLYSPGVSQGFVFQIPSFSHYLLPAFSILDENIGKKIALLNGYENPYEFWEIYYVKPLAKSLCELFLKTGISYHSPHMQNFVIELDQNFAPTGKLILRDIEDVKLHQPYLAAIGEKEMLFHFESYAEEESFYDSPDFFTLYMFYSA